MENKISDQLKADLFGLKNEIGEKKWNRLHVNQLIRVIERLDTFSGECKECENYKIGLTSHIERLTDKYGQDGSLDFKEHQKKINEVISHLQKNHKLISEGYYLSIYISIGTSIGLVYGLVFSDNLSLGLSFGLGIGVAIGASLDADAKKKGLTI